MQLMYIMHATASSPRRPAVRASGTDDDEPLAVSMADGGGRGLSAKK